MAVRTLQLRNSLISILVELRYTLSRLQANPITAAHVPTFQALRDEWTAVHATEIALQESISDAQAKVDAADDDLDAFANRFSKVVLMITKDNRNHPLYVHFFGKKTLSQLQRPVLRGQLDAMKAWIPSLQASEHPELVAMAPELINKVAAGIAATDAKENAKQQNRQFRDVGPRKQLIDKVNGARKEASGALDKLPYQASGLPSDFADHFFRKESNEPDEEDETLGSVKAQIKQLEDDLADRNERLAELEAEAKAVIDAEAAAEQDRKALAALEEELAEKAKQAEALKAKLAKK